jgi:glyoxylase-like metal-dependent hydrolase (beta-lactamase superfamily II)
MIRRLSKEKAAQTASPSGSNAMPEMNRRTMLAGTAAAAGTAVFGPIAALESARASVPLAGKQVPGWYRYKVGEIEVTVVTDGARTFPLPDSYVTNVKKEEVSAMLAANFLDPANLTTSYTPIVVNTGSKLVLIDTGNGPAAAAKPNSTYGQLPVNLAAAGINPGAIDVVVISHFHFDHVNGLLTPDNKLAFPNAEVMVPAVEWKFWTDDGEMSRAPEGRMSDLFKNNRRVFDALNRKVTQYDWNKEVAPGITPIATQGHTPGHTSFIVSSGSGKVYVQSDVTHHTALFTRNPNWHVYLDQDVDMAEATRRKVYDMIVAEKLMIQGFHCPFPGLGHLEKDGDGYRFVPAPWNPAV